MADTDIDLIPAGHLIYPGEPEPEEGRSVMRYGVKLTREGNLWIGVDGQGNPGACTWGELFWAFGDSESAFLLDEEN